MIIHAPRVEIQAERVILSACVSFARADINLPDTLWYSYPASYAAYVLPRADSFYAGLLQTAMALGEDLRVEGPLSPRLLYAAQDYQALFQSWRPKNFSRTIRVAEEETSILPMNACAGKAAAAFSGGLDAFFTLHAMLEEEKRSGASALDYGIYIMGSMRQGLNQKERFAPLVQRYKAVFDHVGKELITVESNVFDFFPPGLDLAMWLSTPLISTALGLGGLLSSFYVGAGISYHELVPAGASPLVNNLLRSERLETYTQGMPFSRVEKLYALKDWEVVQENVLVCFDHHRADLLQNCGICPKCLRTRVLIEAVGLTGRFQTFPARFTLIDYLRWGRWLELGYGWEHSLFSFARSHRPGILPLLWLGLTIGYLRQVLKTLTPGFLKRIIFRFSSPRYYNKAKQAQKNPSISYQ